MFNPITREQDAFKMLVAVMVGAALVIAVTLVSGSSVAGIVVGIGLIALAGGWLWRDYQRMRDAEAGGRPADEASG